MAHREHWPISRQFRGKLALSYGLTSVVTSLFLALLIIGSSYLFMVSTDSPFWPELYLEEKAPQIAAYFVHGPPDREELMGGLRLINSDVPNDWFLGRDKPIYLGIVDTRGRAIGLAPPSNTPIPRQLTSQDFAVFRAVLNNRKSFHYQSADGKMVAITRIEGNGRNVQGWLVMKFAQPDKYWQLEQLMLIFTLPFTWISLDPRICSIVIILTTAIIALICGVGFGYLTARGLTRRFKGLSAAADRWSHGDFSTPVHDTSKDELGQAARQFNRMAEQLQNLLQTQQKLATLEERNRLARDLHDSVKQQVFALSMQIGATKGWLRRNVDTAEERLNEAQRLARQTQQELTSLIRQLRPVALEDKGLVAALSKLATEWTQQTDIAANLRMENAQTLSPTVENALFRVAQETLANVVRHSKATLVQMILTITDDSGTLSVIDNGQGFDTTHHKPLGVGLSSMRERMKALGGDIQVESTPGRGTRVIAYCKWSNGDTGNAEM